MLFLRDGSCLFRSKPLKTNHLFFVLLGQLGRLVFVFRQDLNGIPERQQILHRRILFRGRRCRGNRNPLVGGGGFQLGGQKEGNVLGIGGGPLGQVHKVLHDVLDAVVEGRCLIEGGVEPAEHFWPVLPPRIVEDHVPFAQVLAQNRRLPRKGGLLRIGAHDDSDDDLLENSGCCCLIGVEIGGCGGSGR